MFEDSDPPDISKHPKGEPKAAPFNWKSLTVAELVRFRDEINLCLPPTSLRDMNLEQELLLQFHCLRELQSIVISDEDLPLNQRAQVANSVNTTLSKLVEMQGDVYKQERFKTLEGLMIRHLLKLPEEAAAAFLTEYERVLENLQ